MRENEIYQYSLMSALTSGLASAAFSTPIFEILVHGTFGVGTFEGIDGVMVILNAIAYQLQPR